MEYKLEVIDLEKKYENFSLNKINLKVPKGKIVGFLGPNGSGKTTTIKAILNFLAPDKGNIKILGRANKNLTSKDWEKIGVVLDDSFFSPILNMQEINNLMKNFYRNWQENLYFAYIEKFNIPKDKPLKEFSNGMIMKAKIICAICHKAQLLILDEPTNGLDPIFRYEILTLFTQFVSNKENSILITSHITSDLEHIADDLVFIADGSIILDITKKTLDEEYGIIEIPNNEEVIATKDYLKKLTYKNETLFLVKDKINFQKKYANWPIKKPNLEEMMLILIKGE